MDFEEYYKNYFQKLFILSYRITGDIEDAKDIVQESFINAFSVWDRFRNESSRYTWLYKITLHCAYRYIKKSQKTLSRFDFFKREGISEIDFLNNIDSGEDIENKIITEEIREHCLQAFINCIPKRQRIVFTLRMILELSVRETSEILDLSEESVKVLLFRAKKNIKEIVEKRCELFNENNPCSCLKWAKYYTEKELELKPEPFVGNCKYTRLRDEIKKESDFLNRLKVLYSVEIKNDIKKKLNDIIKQDSLKLLS